VIVGEVGRVGLVYKHYSAGARENDAHSLPKGVCYTMGKTLDSQRDISLKYQMKHAIPETYTRYK
jgi:hypothetical protein